MSVFYFFVLPGMDVSQFDDPVTFLSYVCVSSVQILRAALFLKNHYLSMSLQLSGYLGS